MKIFRSFFLLFLLNALPAFSESSPLNAGASQNELLMAIQSKNLDETIRVLNEIKQLSQPQSVLPLILELWKKKKDKHPDLPWEFLDSDLIRINLCDILLQEHMNGVIKVNVEKIHPFVRFLATSDDPDVAVEAIIGLQMIDDPKDVPLLAQIAAQQSPYTFKVTIIALVEMCSKEAADSVVNLETKITEENRKYIAYFRRKHEENIKKHDFCGR